jgi:hypothetical protein
VERERWFAFRSERLRTFMEAWLVAHALRPIPRPTWATEPEGDEKPGVEEPSVTMAEAREARRQRNADALRKQLREVGEALGPRDLETLVAFAEFLKARRIARSFAYHQEQHAHEASTEEAVPASFEHADHGDADADADHEDEPTSSVSATRG